MAYCSIDKVVGLEVMRFPGGFSDGATSPQVILATKPTATQVGNFINTISAEIDSAILRGGYQIPVTGTDYVSGCNAMGAAWMVEMAINVSGNAEQMKVADSKFQAYQTMLQSIEKNPRLAGAIPALGTQNNIATSDGVVNYQNSNAPFKVSERDW